MNSFDPFSLNDEMQRHHRAFQIWLWFVAVFGTTGLAVIIYVGYKMLTRFGIL